MRAIHKKVTLFRFTGILDSPILKNLINFFIIHSFRIKRKTSQAYRPSHIITVLESIHEVDSENMSALHSACVLGNYPIVRQLLQLRSRVDVLTSKGQSAMHLAVFSGSIECVKELIKSRQ